MNSAKNKWVQNHNSAFDQYGQLLWSFISFEFQVPIIVSLLTLLCIIINTGITLEQNISNNTTTVEQNNRTKHVQWSSLDMKHRENIKLKHISIYAQVTRCQKSKRNRAKQWHLNNHVHRMQRRAYHTLYGNPSLWTLELKSVWRFCLLAFSCCALIMFDLKHFLVFNIRYILYCLISRNILIVVCSVFTKSFNLQLQIKTRKMQVLRPQTLKIVKYPTFHKCK